MKYTALDKVTLTYISFMIVVLGIGFSHLYQPGVHLISYFALLLFSLLMIYLNFKFPSKLTDFTHTFYPFLFLIYLYPQTGYLNTVFFPFLDAQFSQFEAWVFFGSQPSIIFSEWMNQNWFAEVMYANYALFYLVVFGGGLYFYFFQKQDAHKLLFMIICSMMTYYIIFIFLPVAGPHYFFYGDPSHVQLPEGGIFGEFIRLVQHEGERPTGAFPSSHVGMTWIVMCLMWRYNKILFSLLAIEAFLLLFSTVYIKAHYGVDVIFGVLSVPIMLLISHYLYQRFSIWNGIRFSKPVT